MSDLVGNPVFSRHGSKPPFYQLLMFTFTSMFNYVNINHRIFSSHFGILLGIMLNAGTPFCSRRFCSRHTDCMEEKKTSMRVICKNKSSLEVKTMWQLVFLFTCQLKNVSVIG